MKEQWFALPINPDPWAIGPLGIGKKNGKYFPYVGRNVQLASYKEAVADLLTNVAKMPVGAYALEFYFWRRLDGTDKNKKHAADATNLQKATEDALQGVLIENDRDVYSVSSVIVDQGPDVVPVVAMRISMWDGLDPSRIPDNVWRMIGEARDSQIEQPPTQNEWPPRG